MNSKIVELDREIQKINIKDCNNMDYSENLSNVVNIIASNDSEEFATKNSCKYLRWKHKLSSIDNKDVIKDLEILKRKIDDFKESDSNTAEQCDAMTEILTVIADDIPSIENIDASVFNDTDMTVGEEYQAEYNWSASFSENKNKICKSMIHILDRFSVFVSEENWDKANIFASTFFIWIGVSLDCLKSQYKKESV